MKRSKFSVLAVLMLAAAVCSCNGKAGSGKNSNDSISFDSIKVDTTLSLTNDTAGPNCHIKLSLTYAKGTRADQINDSLLRSGVLSPDYLSLSDKHIGVSEAVDSFVSRYLNEYRKFYGELYKADKESAKTYYCEYLLSSNVLTDNSDYYTYIASVYNYMGGAHGSTLSIARNINVKNGKLVTLKDLFVPGYEKPLQEEIIKALCEKYEAKDLKSLSEKTTIFDGIDVYASDNFIIGRKGITFIYSPDEIACHAAGEIRVDVSNDALSRLFKK